MVDKHKYLVSLTQEDAFKLKKLLKELGLPVGQFSVLLDEHVRTLIPIFKEMLERKRSGKQLTLNELIGITEKSAEEVYGPIEDK